MHGKARAAPAYDLAGPQDPTVPVSASPEMAPGLRLGSTLCRDGRIPAGDTKLPCGLTDTWPFSSGLVGDDYGVTSGSVGCVGAPGRFHHEDEAIAVAPDAIDDR